MKRASIVRDPSEDQGTFGLMTYGTSSCKTLELPWRDNRQQRSCIPLGLYECRIVQSPRFGRVYGVMSVPGRSAVLIHPANFAGDIDAGWHTQLHGCIAPCFRVGQMRNPAGKMQMAGLLSRPAWDQFMSWAGGDPFELEIT